VTPHTLEVLRLLQNGEFRSGEAIGRTLGITRGSVSNALANVDEFGLTVHKVHAAIAWSRRCSGCPAPRS
jgi:BirA family biotin operon repressor/biotin-[acetyl-CoA-carboxylase] ligase